MDLITNTTPDFVDLSKVNLREHNWNILKSIWQQFDPHGDIMFSVTSDIKQGLCWVIKEQLKNGSFEMHRSMVNNYRITINDSFGLLGLSLVNSKDDRVILTEGVSDFFTAKFLCPDKNVLGVTTLSGSVTAKTILLNLFNKFIICADNDANADRNTGLSNAKNLATLLKTYDKQIKIFIPAAGFKDITDNFIYCLKVNKFES